MINYIDDVLMFCGTNRLTEDMVKLHRTDKINSTLKKCFKRQLSFQCQRKHAIEVKKDFIHLTSSTTNIVFGLAQNKVLNSPGENGRHYLMIALCLIMNSVRPSLTYVVSIHRWEQRGGIQVKSALTRIMP